MWPLLELPRAFLLALAAMTEAVPTDQPLQRHGELAAAIASACERDPFRDGDLARCVADTVALGTYESTLTKTAIGDDGKSFGAFQWHLGDRRVLEDADYAVEVAHRMMRQSRRVDPTHPYAFYARGGRYLRCLRGDDAPVCAEARSLSDHRAALADRLRAKASSR